MVVLLFLSWYMFNFMTTAYPHPSMPWAALSNRIDIGKSVAKLIVVALYTSSEKCKKDT